MSTDLERFKTFLSEAGVPFSEDSSWSSLPARPPEFVLELNNWGDRGYRGFTSSWHFSEAGKLIAIGHWE